MFCQPDFITNKIVAFLNAYTDWSKKKKKNAATEITLI